MVSKKSKNKQIPIDDGFLMSPKVDFVFKLIFGDEKELPVPETNLSCVGLMITKD